MTALNDRGLLSESPDLARRVRMALLREAGEAIAAGPGDDSQAVQAKAFSFAKQVLADTDRRTRQFVELAAAYGDVITDTEGKVAITDEALETLVQAVWSQLAIN